MADQDPQLAPFRHLLGKKLVPDSAQPGADVRERCDSILKRTPRP